MDKIVKATQCDGTSIKPCFRSGNCCLVQGALASVEANLCDICADNIGIEHRHWIFKWAM